VFGGLQLLGLIGIIYGPVIMILLVTSIDVYTKYMLRSDLEALAERGDLDLVDLGLVLEEEDDQEPKESGMIVGVLKGLAARFRQEPGGQKREQQETT
jgi:hypothetical protein